MGDNEEELKKEINNLIWMYAPPELTLEEAEQVALKVLGMIAGRKQ